ncbi:retrovirus-related pol polyprotein from transposon TNT 1-94 [Tanacetum coccineum]
MRGKETKCDKTSSVDQVGSTCGIYSWSNEWNSQGSNECFEQDIPVDKTFSIKGDDSKSGLEQSNRTKRSELDELERLVVSNQAIEQADRTRGTGIIVLLCWLKVTMNLERSYTYSQGLPRHYLQTNLNQTSTEKEIWDNVEMLMQGSGRNISTRKEDLFGCPQPTAQSPNDALMATMTQIANLLSGFQKQFPPTNNQLRTSSNSRTHATVHDGHIVTEPVQRKAPGNNGNTGTRGKKVICYNCRGEGHVARQCKEPKRKMDSQYFKDKALLMEAKEKGDVLDAEAEAFLADVECTAPYDQPQALTTTNMFQANHEDAYDSDVDEGPNAAVAFMANLSSTSATNNPVNEVHSNDNQIFDNVDYQIQEMHQEEHLDSDAETEIDDNTIPYHQYLLDTEAQNVPTEKDLFGVISVLASLPTNLASKASKSAKTWVLLLFVKVDLQAKFWPVFEKLMLFFLNSKIREFEQIFDELEAEYEQCVLDNKNLTIEKKNLLIINECLIAEYLEKDICSIVLTSDIVVPPSSNCFCEDLRSACDREHTKVLELEAEISKQKQLITDSEKRFAFLEQNYNGLKVENVKSGKDGANHAENTKLKAQVTGTTSSGPSTSKTPKVLAPGMYNLGSKYIPPPKRTNWVTPTPLPKKKQEVKPTSGASKTVLREPSVSITETALSKRRNRTLYGKLAPYYAILCEMLFCSYGLELFQEAAVSAIVKDQNHQVSLPTRETGLTSNLIGIRAGLGNAGMKFMRLERLDVWYLYPMDVKTAFLNGELNEVVYVSQPEVCRSRASFAGVPTQESSLWTKLAPSALDYKFLKIPEGIFINHSQYAQEKEI